jgi:hypothetical protein
MAKSIIRKELRVIRQTATEEPTVVRAQASSRAILPKRLMSSSSTAVRDGDTTTGSDATPSTYEFTVMLRTAKKKPGGATSKFEFPNGILVYLPKSSFPGEEPEFIETTFRCRVHSSGISRRPWLVL